MTYIHSVQGLQGPWFLDIRYIPWGISRTGILDISMSFLTISLIFDILTANIEYKDNRFFFNFFPTLIPQGYTTDFVKKILTKRPIFNLDIIRWSLSSHILLAFSFFWYNVSLAISSLHLERPFEGPPMPKNTLNVEFCSGWPLGPSMEDQNKTWRPKSQKAETIRPKNG